MKYPCGLIQDLLPLYLDKVCSEESKQIIESHLDECSACKEYFAELSNAQNIVIPPENTNTELKKAASFQAVKKKILKKQILICSALLVILAVACFSVIELLKNSNQIIQYEKNISVSMTDGSLIARLTGNQANYTKIKRVEITENAQTKTYLFFCMSGSKWDDIITSDKVFSEYTLCAFDKGAQQIDAVYYFTGDYTGIEIMSASELQKVIDNSVLLWNK